MQCRKQAHLRNRTDYEEELKEEKRKKAISFKSDGLKNVSKNMLGDSDLEDSGDIDWVLY